MSFVDRPEEVYTSPDGELVAVHVQAEGVDGTAQWRIVNEGVEMEVLSMSTTLSEGSENARVYVDLGYDRLPSGTSATINRVINKLGAGGVSGGYNRSTAEKTFPKDARPVLEENDNLFMTSNGDTAGTGDTFKVFMSVWLKPTGNGSGTRL